MKLAADGKSAKDREKELKKLQKEKEKAQLKKEKERQKKKAQREREKAKVKARKEKERAKLKEKKARERDRLKKQKQKQKEREAKRQRSRATTTKQQSWRDVIITPDSNEEVLKNILRRLQKTVNRQARKLREWQDQYGVENPALHDLIISGGMISLRQGSFEDLYFEYLRAKRFMDDVTHTKRGFDEFIREIAGIGREPVDIDSGEDSTRLESEEIESDSDIEIPDNILDKWQIFGVVEGTYPILGEDRSLKYLIADS